MTSTTTPLSTDWVHLATYSTRAEAELTKGLLEQNRIRVILSADDAGGLYPQFSALSGAKILVQFGDLKSAQDLTGEASLPQ